VLDDNAGPNGHCFPPVRPAAERALLWERVLAGQVDVVASDHSPCPPAMKAATPPWAGVDEVGMTVPLLLTDGRLPVAAITELTTAAARILRLPGKGAITAGFDADLVLVDPGATWVPDGTSLWSRHRCSPYAGRPLTGRVVATLVRGRVMFSLDAGPREVGHGRVIRPG
jgi:allantoinase